MVRQKVLLFFNGLSHQGATSTTRITAGRAVVTRHAANRGSGLAATAAAAAAGMTGAENKHVLCASVFLVVGLRPDLPRF